MHFGQVSLEGSVHWDFDTLIETLIGHWIDYEKAMFTYKQWLNVWLWDPSNKDAFSNKYNVSISTQLYWSLKKFVFS